MWDEEKLKQYIADKFEENAFLEYKSGDSLGNSEGKKNEISKDVSSFANSGGGVIIYGISENSDNLQHLPQKIDPIKRDDFSKETLEQILNSRISPKINGIIITPVTIGHSVDNLVVYVVEIPQGQTAHQASDKRYYKRYNFMSVPMDDWEIKDVINRSDRTIVNIEFVPKFPAKDYTYLLQTRKELVFDVVATNDGNKVVQYCDCMIAMKETFAHLIKPEPKKMRDSDYCELYLTNEYNHQIEIEKKTQIVNVSRIPILPKTWIKLGKITINCQVLKEDLEFVVRVSTDDYRSTKKVKGLSILGTGNF